MHFLHWRSARDVQVATFVVLFILAFSGPLLNIDLLLSFSLWSTVFGLQPANNQQLSAVFCRLSVYLFGGRPMMLPFSIRGRGHHTSTFLPKRVPSSSPCLVMWPVHCHISFSLSFVVGRLLLYRRRFEFSCMLMFSKWIRRCTNAQFYGCERTGTAYNILNPIKSARIRTVHSFSFQYGKVEVRAKMPSGDWLWPGNNINLLLLSSTVPVICHDLNADETRSPLQRKIFGGLANTFVYLGKCRLLPALFWVNQCKASGQLYQFFPNYP